MSGPIFVRMNSDKPRPYNPIEDLLGQSDVLHVTGELSRKNPISDEPSVFLTVEDLASITRESVAVWRKRLFRQEIPFAKLGRNIRILRSDLALWITARTRGGKR